MRLLYDSIDGQGYKHMGIPYLGFSFLGSLCLKQMILNPLLYLNNPQF